MSFIDVLREAFALIHGWQGLGLWAAVSGVLKLLVDASKTKLFGGLFDKLGPVGKMVVILSASALLVGTSILAAGGSLGEAVSAIFQSSAGAMLLHEILSLFGLDDGAGEVPVTVVEEK